MEAYMAVISLHNLGYQLTALEGDQVAIKPALKAEHAEMIRAIREDARAACKAIQCLPHLCAAIMPAPLNDFAETFFRGMQEKGYVRIVAIRYCRASGATEWVYVPTHKKGYKAVKETTEDGWGVIYSECKEEGQRWGKRTGGPAAQLWV